MRLLSKIPEKQLKGKTVVLRLDLNVQDEEIKTSPRIAASADTVRWLAERGARVVVLSHRGRPDPKKSNNTASRKKDSLLPVARALLSHIGSKQACIVARSIEKARLMIPSLQEGQVVFLENTRFFEGEEKNSATLAKQYATLGDIYVNDAFSVSHRKEASLVAITRHLPSYAGLQLEKEIQALSSVMKNPAKPLVLVLGGAKISDKMRLLDAFAGKADAVLVGGALATTLFAANDIPVGESLYERDALSMARKCLSRHKAIRLPSDVILDKTAMVDIGEKTARAFSETIKTAGTIIWNGPLGYIEDKRFEKGTLAIAKAIASSRAYSVVGGGETTAFLHKHKLAKKFGFISTGGGAMLAFLSGEPMPAIEALR